MATDKEILQFTLDLEAFFGKAYEPAQHPAIMRLLRHVDATVIDALQVDIEATCKWLPKPMEIRDALRAIRDNNGRATTADDDPTGAKRNHELFWLAMDNLHRVFKGGKDNLHMDKAYQYVMRSQHLGEETPEEAEAWRLAQEQAAEWMQEELQEV